VECIGNALKGHKRSRIPRNIAGRLC